MSKGIYDAESSVVLKAAGSVAVTATDTGTSQDFDWDATPGFAVVLNVKSIDRTTTDETYVLSIESLDSGDANQVAQFTAPAITETGEYRFLVDGQTAAKIDADAAKVRSVMTLGGTTPSIEYACWIQPAYGVGGRP